MQQRKGNRVDEERVCADCFVTYLRERNCGEAITYEREAQDPPDFRVSIADRKFAVEVVSITDEETTRHHSQCSRLARAIMAQAKQTAVLSGGYALTVHLRPSIPRLRSSEGRDIQRRALEYVRRTAGDDQAEPYELIGEGRDRVVIQKLTPNDAFVALVGPVSKLIGIQRIIADMAELMQTAIVCKRKKLLTKDPDILKHCAGAVLLLYDAYGPSEARHARAAFEKVRDYDWFHTIFVASPVWHELGMPIDGKRKKRDGSILFTKEPAWRGTGRRPDGA